MRAFCLCIFQNASYTMLIGVKDTKRCFWKVFHNQLLGMTWLKWYKHLGSKASQNLYYVWWSSESEVLRAEGGAHLFHYTVLWGVAPMNLPWVTCPEQGTLLDWLEQRTWPKWEKPPRMNPCYHDFRNVTSNSQLWEDSVHWVSEEPKCTNCDSTRNQELWRTITLEVLNPFDKQHVCQLPEDLHVSMTRLLC